MHFITKCFVAFLLCNFAASYIIIVSDRDFNDFADNDISMDDLNTKGSSHDVLETVYLDQKVGKSHRFFFTVGERKDGKCNLFIVINLCD